MFQATTGTRRAGVPYNGLFSFQFCFLWFWKAWLCLLADQGLGFSVSTNVFSF